MSKTSPTSGRRRRPGISPGQSPRPTTPRELQIRKNRSQGSGIHALRRRRLQIWLRSNRGDPRAATAVHHPHAARATQEDGQQHRRAPPAARIRAALTRRGRRPSCRSAPPESRAARSLPPPSLAARAGFPAVSSGGSKGKEGGGGGAWRPPESPQSGATRGPSEAFFQNGLSTLCPVASDFASACLHITKVVSLVR